MGPSWEPPRALAPRRLRPSPARPEHEPNRCEHAHPVERRRPSGRAAAAASTVLAATLAAWLAAALPAAGLLTSRPGLSALAWLGTLPWLLPALSRRSVLRLLTILAGLTVASRLSILALLPITLAASILSVLSALQAEALQFVAQLVHMIKRRGLGSLARSALARFALAIARPHSLLSLSHLVAERLQPRRNHRRLSFCLQMWMARWSRAMPAIRSLKMTS